MLYEKGKLLWEIELSKIEDLDEHIKFAHYESDMLILGDSQNLLHIDTLINKIT